MPNLNTPSGLKFGGNAGQRAASGDRQMMIKTFREDSTEVRALWENPLQTWVTIWEHYDKALGKNGLSYPCGYDAGLPTCIGHRAAVANEEEKDKDAKKLDKGWQIRRVTPRSVAPFLTKSADGRDFVNLFKMGNTFRDHIVELYTHYGSITSRDAKVVKVRKADDNAPGAEMRVNFSYILDLNETDRPYVAELRALYLEVAAGMSAPQGSAEQAAAQARWLEGNWQIAGVPDIRDLLAEKYMYALAQYGTNLDNEMLVAAQIEGGATIAAPTPVVQQPVAAPNPHNPVADEMARITARLTELNVPVPPGADLTGLQSILALYDPPTAAPAATPAPAAPAAAPPAAAPAAAAPATPAVLTDEDQKMMELLEQRGVEWPDDVDHDILVFLVEASNPPPAEAAPAAPAAAVTVPATPVTADGEPNFRAMKTPAIQEWLAAKLTETGEAKYQVPEGAGRSEILGIAEKAIIPF